MSWSINQTEAERSELPQALEDAFENVAFVEGAPRDRIRSQFEAARDAAFVACDSGELGDGPFLVNLSGHVTVGDDPQRENIVVNVSGAYGPVNAEPGGVEPETEPDETPAGEVSSPVSG